jgi:carbamoyltransferase
MSLTILGISAYYHDAACCVLRDGQLVAAAQEERFTRCKHDPRLPVRAARQCLGQAGLSLTDVDVVAYYEDPFQKADRQRWMAAQAGRAPPGHEPDPRQPFREIREVLGFEGPIDCVGHHEAHAASAYFFSGFDEAAVLVVDGVGEWATTSYGVGRGPRLELFQQVRFPHSLGLLYAALTAYLGFEVNDGEYKVMGLAPYGRPRYVEQLRTLYEADDAGGFRLRLEYFDFLAGERMVSERLCELLGQPPREPESELSTFAQDVAHSLQVVLEEVLLAKVQYLHRRAPLECLCLAGGVALNCVANSRLRRDGPFRHLFVQPAAGDAGGALGAAALVYTRRTGERPACGPLEHVYLGPAYAAGDVLDLLSASAARFESYAGREEELLEAVAERLAGGAVVGWFHGPMEFGPRALGARSILADPRRPDMRDRINRAVKMREAFRPFAPAVLAAAAADHFAIDHPTPFMLETCMVRSPLDLPAVTHVDGSARLQTVDPAVLPRFARLLAAFARRTGCPVLLNTSFNRRGEPIVATPLDALACFVGSGLDCLVIEDVLLPRDGLPRAWVEWFGSWDAPRSSIRHDVYSFF